MVLAAAISIPVSLSLGGHFSFVGFDLLTFFDEITNTVLMPLGALVACLCVGFVVSKEEYIGDVSKNPTIARVMYYITRYITPVLILVVEIFGVVSNVLANTGYWAVIAAALLLVLAVETVYFMLLQGKDTGCNADELTLSEND